MTVLRMVLVWFGVSFWAKELVLPIQNVMGMMERSLYYKEKKRKYLTEIGIDYPHLLAHCFYSLVSSLYCESNLIDTARR